MKISIVTVTHRSERHMPRYVESFLKHNGHLDPSNVEFIIVENSGNDKIGDHFDDVRLAGFDVKIIITTNDGFGSGCNAGASKAIGGVLLFVNPDIIFNTSIENSEYFIKTWGTISQINSEGVVASFDVLPEFKSIVGEIRRIYRKITPIPNRWIHKAFPIGAFLAVDRHLFIKIGGFDERFFLYYEETEIARRLHKEVGPPIFIPEIQIIHESFGSQATSAATNQHEANGLLTYVRVTGQWRALRTRILTLLLMCPVHASARHRLLCLWSAYARGRSQ